MSVYKGCLCINAFPHTLMHSQATAVLSSCLPLDLDLPSLVLSCGVFVWLLAVIVDGGLPPSVVSSCLST